MQQIVLKHAKVIWDYHHMDHEITKAECIFVLGSHDTRVAERAAELWLQQMAPLLIFSGGLGRLTDGLWNEPEADKFAKIAVEMGVPPSAILVENKSTNTGENILFTMKLLKEKGLDPQSFIVVQKPYMERRSFATFKKHLPDKEVMVTSPQIPFNEYTTKDITTDEVINIMVGDLQRIHLYAQKGYQVAQTIPVEVWNAYHELIALGYDKQLIAE